MLALVPDSPFRRCYIVGINIVSVVLPKSTIGGSLVGIYPTLQQHLHYSYLLKLARHRQRSMIKEAMEGSSVVVEQLYDSLLP